LSGVVVDASVALAWCFPDEASEYADRVLVALKGQTLVVPGLWGLEITNALLTGERRKRLKQPEILHFVALLEALSILQDGQAVSFSRFTAGKAADFERHEVCACIYPISFSSPSARILSLLGGWGT
jgi:predicted nucleic acid-binding protein